MTKILVVDDERDIRELLIDELTDCGYETAEAENGVEALERVKSEHPDLVLLDLMMPIMDGTQVLEILKSEAQTANLPVVLLTAVSADEREQRALAMGVNHYVTKPWEPGTIQTVIKVTLRETGYDEASSGSAAD
ncbi:MAG: response regulator [Chloroflexi bacterium]|nr:response regulator [Chloroflexota bacterium]